MRHLFNATTHEDPGILPNVPNDDDDDDGYGCSVRGTPQTGNSYRVITCRTQRHCHVHALD